MVQSFIPFSTPVLKQCVNMESCYDGMSTRLKQRAVTEFLSAENATPAEIHRRLQAVYGENTVNVTTVNRWAIK